MTCTAERASDGFDGLRRRFLAGRLAESAKAMRAKERREFLRFLYSLEGEEEPILPRRARQQRRKAKKLRRQGELFGRAA